MAELKFIAAHFIHKNKIPFTPKTLTLDCIDLVNFFNDRNIIEKTIKEGISFDNIKYLLTTYRLINYNIILKYALKYNHTDLVPYTLIKCDEQTKVKKDSKKDFYALLKNTNANPWILMGSLYY